MLNYEVISKKALENNNKTKEIKELTEKLKELETSLSQDRVDLEKEICLNFSGIPEDFEILLSNELILPISGKLNSKLLQEYSFVLKNDFKNKKIVIFEIEEEKHVENLNVVGDFLLKYIPNFNVEDYTLFNYKKSYLSLGVEIQKIFLLEIGREDMTVCYNKEKGFMIISLNVVGDFSKKCSAWLPDLPSLKEEVRNILNGNSENYHSVEKKIDQK